MRRHVQLLGCNGVPGGSYRPLLRELERSGCSVGITEYYKGIGKIDTNLYANCVDYVRDEARSVRQKLPKDTKLVAFGHSLGGVLAWLASKEDEVFDEVIAFDPPMFSPFSRAVLCLFQATGLIERWSTVRRWRRRPASFASREAAERWVRAQKFYQQFDHECIDAFLEVGINDTGCFHFLPEFEAQFFIQTPSILGYGGDPQMYSCKSTCPVSLYYSTHHQFVNQHDISWLESYFRRRQWPVELRPVDFSHFYPLEQPQKFARDFLIV